MRHTFSLLHTNFWEMKKQLFLLLLAVFSLGVSAQTKFGYVSFKEILTSLPEYTVAEKDLGNLQQKCEQEIARSEKDINQRFSEYIDGQESFPEIIRVKRQKELQELMEKSLSFKNDASKTLRDARNELMQPLRNKVTEAIQKVCEEGGYDYIIDTDQRSYIAINKEKGTDVTAAVKQQLGIE